MLEFDLDTRLQFMDEAKVSLPDDALKTVARGADKRRPSRGVGRLVIGRTALMLHKISRRS
jgi:hypothetical protein